MAHAGERPCVGIQGCLNPLQIEYPCVRVMNNGLMFDEGMVANTQNHGRGGILPFGRYADAHGVGFGIRQGIATGKQRNAPVS